MMDLHALCLLVFSCLLSADGVFADTDCHPKGYGRNALHVCNEGVASGSVVAIDASKFNGASCKCRLTNSGKTDTNFTVTIHYITRNEGRIKFYVDDDEYKETNTDRVYTSNGNTISILAKMEANNTENTRDGNPCLAFKLPKNDSSENLTINCSNGSGVSPEMVENTSSNNTRTDSTTVTLTTVKTTRQSRTPVSDTQRSTTGPTHPTISTTHSSTSPTKSNGSISENTRETDSNADHMLGSGGVGMETTSLGLQESEVTVGMMEEKLTTSSVPILLIIVAVGIPLAVVVIVLFVCYFKRRRSNTSPAIVEPNGKCEEDYEVTENAMYIPMETRNLLEDPDKQSTHTYEEADMDMIANNRKKQSKPPLLRENDRHINELMDGQGLLNDLSKETRAADKSDGVGEKLDNEESNFVYDLAKDIVVYDLAREIPDTDKNNGHADVITTTDKDKTHYNVPDSPEHIYDISS